MTADLTGENRGAFWPVSLEWPVRAPKIHWVVTPRGIEPVFQP